MGNKHYLTPNGNWITIGDNELYHWKYVKREKVNGTWRYFYNNEEYQAYKDAQSNRTKADSKAQADLINARSEAQLLAAKSLSAARKAPGGGEYEIKTDRHLDQSKMGTDVAQAQKILKALGYDLGATGNNKDGIDGSFGPVTKAAVMEYQKKNGLKVDGIIGPETMGALTSDSDKMNKANKEARDLSKQADEAAKKSKVAAKKYASVTKSTAEQTTAARKAYEETAGAKVADFLNDSSDKIDRAKTATKNFVDTKITGKSYWDDVGVAGDKMVNAKSQEEFDKAREESKEALDNYFNKSLRGNIRSLRLKGNKWINNFLSKT